VGQDSVGRTPMPPTFGGGDGELPMALPSTSEEVAEVLRAATRDGLRVGVGSGGFAGFPPGPPPDLVLSTAHLRQVEIYEPADLTGTFGAGLTGQGLADLTTPHGQWLPLDPDGWRAATLGGMVAVGHGGLVEPLYGAPRDLVLGLTLVTGNGRILEVGGRVVKNVAGFDLVRLAVGSRGALGVITRVSVRLFPLPERDEVVVVQAPDLQALMPAADAVRRSPLPLAGTILRWDSGAGGPELVIRIQGNEEPVAAQRTVLADELRGAGLEPRTGQDREAVLRDPAPRGIVLEARSLPGRLPQALSLVQAGPVSSFGPDVQAHLQTGRIRVAFDARADGDDLGAAVATLRSRFQEIGGSLVIGKGPRALLERVHPMSSPGGAARLMRGLRHEFDPSGTLLPGPFEWEEE